MKSEDLKLKWLEKDREKYLQDDKNKVIRHALSSNQFDAVFKSNDNAEDTQFVFSIDVETLPVTNQKRSGRCWIFSASNVLREIIAKKCNIKGQFEISQNYLAYYDKLEKFNYFAQSLIELVEAGAKHDDRKVAFLLAGVGDGGQWSMFVNIVKKYGIVPKSAMVETEQSSGTMGSNRLCNAALREYASKIFKNWKANKDHDKLMKLKEDFVDKIYNIITSSYGLPPEKFDFEYVDKDNKYHIEAGLTPLEFFNKYIGEDIDELVSVINAPTDDKKYNQTYTIEYVNNVYGGNPVTHLNIPFDRMEKAIINQLKDGEIVWFGSDVGHFGDRENGVWDTNLYDYVTPFKVNRVFDKADMLDFYQSAMGHAMCIVGVDLKRGKPIRWKIENSWGDASGKQGIYLMSEDFFKAFTYQVAIRKKYLSKEELDALNKEPKLLPPWDPFGTLAD
ncbi:MAG: C1 family peptidase [Bacilli bacterium]|nr:C1 family peptidase [Bacilli bacterium]